MANGRVVEPGIYPGSIEAEINAAGEQTARRLSIVLSAGHSDEEAIDITDLYDENSEPQ